jgi:hypothetical protein
MLIPDAGAKRSLQKQTAHLLSQMGGCIAIRHHGGITPEAETLTRDASREPVPASLETAPL